MKNPIEKHFMFAFEGKLERLAPDMVDMVVGDIQDICAFDEEVLRRDDLPKEIPEAVRIRMVELSRQRDAAARQLDAIVEQLSVAAVRIHEKLEKQAERKTHRSASAADKKFRLRKRPVGNT